MGIYVGFDIGGTKCAAVTGIEKDGELTILGREAFATPADQQEALDRLCALAEKLSGGQEILGIGISSGENRALDAAQQATNSALLEASIAGASRVLFSIAGGPDLTLTEVDEAARTVEACADENANIIYGQIIDESMGDQVRITVIATGFKMNAPQQSSLDFSRKDLFASTDPTPAPSSAPVTFSTTPSAGRFADEDYIPDFLRRQR